MLDAKTLKRWVTFASGLLNTLIAGSPSPESVDWELNGWKKLSWLLAVITRDPGQTLLSLETNIMRRHRSESKSFTALPFVSTGEPYPSMFEGRWYIEGLEEQYVNAPFTRVNGPQTTSI